MMIPHHYSILFTFLFVAALAWPAAWAQNLSDAQISLVEARLADGAKASWELGARSQALLELNAPTYSVLSPQPLPPATSIPLNLTDSMNAVLSIAHTVVANRSISNGNITGPQPLVNDTSVGDPASIGMAVLLASWTGQWFKDGLNYAGAAQDQLDHLLQASPHTSDGAISHVSHEVQLWSDFVYMVPPFLAYYGVIFENATILFEAYNQIKLYRSYLSDTASNNLWRHVLLGGGVEDQGHWSTGNGWAAAGMLRVLGTIRNSRYNSSMLSEQTDLVHWITEIHDGMYKNLDANFVFRNYADQPLSSTNFYDTSSTALMTSTVYRLSLIAGVNTYIPQAENSRRTLSQAAPGGTGGGVTSPGNMRWASKGGSKPAAGTSSKRASGAPPSAAGSSSGTTKLPTGTRSGTPSVSPSPLPSSTPGGVGGSTLTLTIANGTLVPPGATPQPTYCPVSVSMSNSTVTATATATTAATATASSPSSKAKRNKNVTTAASSSSTSTAALNSTATIPIPSMSCIMPPIVTTTVTYTPPIPTTTLPADSPGSLLHFTNQGWLSPVVNPYDYGVEGTDSPEAQAFVIMMQAAYRDWAAMNASLATAHSRSAAVRSGSGSVGWLWCLIAAGSFLHWVI